MATEIEWTQETWNVFTSYTGENTVTALGSLSIQKSYQDLTDGKHRDVYLLIHGKEWNEMPVVHEGERYAF